MGRSVSTPSNCEAVAYRDISEFGAIFEELENGDFDYDNIVDYDSELGRDDFEFFIDGIREEAKANWASFEDCETWVGNEDRAILENGHAYIGVSEYCGLASIWLVPKEGEFEELSAAWCATIAAKFERKFGEFVKVGTFSNGESVYERVA